MTVREVQDRILKIKKEKNICILAHAYQSQDATAVPLDSGNIRLVFDELQRAITPGQAAVLYDGDIVLGGGKISKRLDFHTNPMVK